jgi:hypothetical protein
MSVPPLCSVFPRGPWGGIVTSRSGYEAAENRQNGADAPILSLLNAIYLVQQFQTFKAWNACSNNKMPMCYKKEKRIMTKFQGKL